MTDPFLLHLPKTQAVPILASLPHSGLWLPDSIRRQLNIPYRHYLPNQDWHLDRLYGFLPELGITVLQATHSRYVVDLNRALNKPLLGSFWRSPIPEKTAFEQALYQTQPTQTEVEARIKRYYQPYHHQLQTQLTELIQQFGRVYLLDLHSFLGLITEDICLGNANGESCSETMMATVEQAFRDQQYQVVQNKVFSGGYITRHYGQQPQVEAMQIEMRYPVYLEAKQLNQPLTPDWDVPEFYAAQAKIRVIFNQIVESLPPE